MNTEAPIILDEVEPPPTWAQLRAEGPLLIDDEHQKLAVYVGGYGSIVITEQSLDDPKPSHIVIDPETVPALAAALVKARDEGLADQAAIEADYRQSEVLEATQS